MLRSAKWIAQREDADDEDVISFTLSRLDSARSSLGQVVREWRRARRGAERGDPAAMMAFRNTVLGLSAEHGAADVDRLFELRLREFDPSAVEQVTCGIDVQADRLVHVVLGFDAGSAEVWVLDYGVTLGDPTEDDVWAALTSSLGRSFAGLPVSCVSVDAGFSTGDVRKQCNPAPLVVELIRLCGAPRTVRKKIFFVGYVSVSDRAARPSPEYVPDPIAAAFEEGAKCLATGCSNAAAAMFRLALDIATVGLLPSDDAEPNARTRRSLGLRLEWLFDAARRSLGCA